MKKYLILTVISLFISYGMAKSVFDIYKSDKTVALKSDEYYFLELGIYDNYDNMFLSSSKLGNYIYNVIDDKYHVYICISKNEDTINKAVDYYKEKGLDTRVKEFYLDDRVRGLIDAIDVNDNIDDMCSKSIAIYKEG